MSASILLACDYPMEGGTCARRIVLDAASTVHARERAARQGWTTNGYGDICPYH